MSRHVYGPVPSRRLGRSLGVSLVPPKTCTYSCVYCQLGRTTHQMLERISYFDTDQVMWEIEEALDGAGEVDHVTFVGDGEPTLSRDMGLLAREVRLSLGAPVAVITNGALLHDPLVREELMAADRVLPTLSTVVPGTWRRMHRPHRELELGKVIEGLVTFGEEHAGDLWLEVMLVKGLNDSDEELLALRGVIDRVGPDRIDLLVPTRPPTEPWAEAPDPDRVLRAEVVLGTGDALVREADGSFSVSGHSSAREALLAIGSRHPLREGVAEDICLKLNGGGTVARMVEEGELLRVRYRNDVFLIPRHLTSRGNDDYHQREVGR